MIPLKRSLTGSEVRTISESLFAICPDGIADLQSFIAPFEQELIDYYASQGVDISQRLPGNEPLAVPTEAALSTPTPSLEEPQPDLNPPAAGGGPEGNPPPTTQPAPEVQTTPVYIAPAQQENQNWWQKLSLKTQLIAGGLSSLAATYLTLRGMLKLTDWLDSRGRPKFPSHGVVIEDAQQHDQHQVGHPQDVVEVQTQNQASLMQQRQILADGIEQIAVTWVQQDEIAK